MRCAQTPGVVNHLDHDSIEPSLVGGGPCCGDAAACTSSNGHAARPNPPAWNTARDALRDQRDLRVHLARRAAHDGGVQRGQRAGPRPRTGELGRGSSRSSHGFCGAPHRLRAAVSEARSSRKNSAGHRHGFGSKKDPRRSIGAWASTAQIVILIGDRRRIRHGSFDLAAAEKCGHLKSQRARPASKDSKRRSTGVGGVLALTRR